jgi:hypothetical protein
LVDAFLTERVSRRVLSPSATPPTLQIASAGPMWRFTNANSSCLVTTTIPLTALPLTINCFFNPTTVSSTRTLVSVAAGGTSTDYYALEATNTALIRARAGDSTSTSSALSTTNTVANALQMATGVFSANNARAAYLNGAGKGTQTSSRAPGTLTRIMIGALGIATPSQFFDGYLQQVAIWNRALSDDEVAYLYDPAHRYELFDWVVRRSFVVKAGGNTYSLSASVTTTSNTPTVSLSRTLRKTTSLAAVSNTTSSAFVRLLVTPSASGTVISNTPTVGISVARKLTRTGTAVSNTPTVGVSVVRKLTRTGTAVSNTPTVGVTIARKLIHTGTTASNTPTALFVTVHKLVNSGAVVSNTPTVGVSVVRRLIRTGAATSNTPTLTTIAGYISADRNLDCTSAKRVKWAACRRSTS